MCEIRISKIFVLVVITTIMQQANAHDTTRVHPRISQHAIELIRTSDQADGKYSELYRPEIPGQLLFWGDDQNPEQENYAGYYGRHVIGGVVMEDNPVTRVIDHFYHSRTAAPLTIPIVDLIFFNQKSSDAKALEMFNKSVELYGYNESGSLEPAKPLSYWFFGRALHHLEDMNSPAHVHNDAHLVTGNVTVDEHLNEHDDYEGIYLPPQINGAPVVNYFNGTQIKNIVNMDDVWSRSNSDALSLRVFNAVRYHGQLEFPTDGNPPANPNGDGEIAEMFPNGRLHWVDDAILIPAHWEINGVGKYHYSSFSSDRLNAWWRTTDEGDTDNDYYYIEQSGVVPPPQFMRPSLMQPYIPGTTVMQANSRPLGEIYAQSLLPLATNYAAGFAQYWYDIVNSPPYLKQVTVSQNAVNVYKARWEDVYAVKTFTLTGPSVAILDDVRNYSYTYVSRRVLTPELNPPRFINHTLIIDIILEFSEAVEIFENGLPSPFFSLELGGVNLLSGNYSVTRDGLAADGIGEIWTISIDQAILQGLNGKLPLTVRTWDKNNHHVNGAALDDNPGTPARRQATYPDYPWHTQTTIGANGETGADAYETGQGDQTHVLLLDTTSPIRSVTGVAAP